MMCANDVIPRNMLQSRPHGNGLHRSLLHSWPSSHRACRRNAVADAAATSAAAGHLAHTLPASQAAQRGSLRLFLDSADVQQWRKWAPTGTLWGFTTNPLILERDKVPCNLEAIRNLVAEATALGVQELQVQAWGATAQDLTACARDLLELDVGSQQGQRPGFLTIKLPCTPAGLEAAKALTGQKQEGMPQPSITITGVYHQYQVLACLGVGADYMAPYLGRMADKSSEEDAMQQIAGMEAAVRAAGADMRVLVASIRHPQQMALLAAQGCDTFTFSPAVMEQLCCSSSTEQAVADFEEAARRNS